jgi:acetylornithine/succinyldiaminopimelate/putrescine aminotransferase
LALDRAYYDQAWALTRQMGSLLVVDSIQAALRAHGCLSVIDYPGYETCEPPDIETYSKALNAGQFPLSIAALREEVAATYVHGLYGNTMTANPRAMEVACAVLDGITDDLRQNIRDRGKEFVARFKQLAEDFPGTIDRVVGTGLMVCALLNPQKYVVVGEGGFEQWLRINGCEMIHGGEHGLRFTPSFDITSAEVDMIVELVGRGLQEIPANAEPLCR